MDRPVIYNPFATELRSDPYPIYLRIRSADPVQFNPYANLWSLTRYAECVSVLRDRRFSSKLAQGLRRRHSELPTSMLNTDPPEHTRLRTPVGHLFSRARIHRTRESVRSLATGLLMETSDGREADLVEGFARPLVTRALLEMFGVPRSDASRVSGLIGDASLNLDPLALPETQGRADQASAALSSYFLELISTRRRTPGGDLISALVDVAVGGATFSTAEILATCNLLAIGSHDPSVHLIGNGLLALLRHPQEMRRIQADLSLIPSAVEEFLRFDSPIQLAARVAVEDVEVGPVTVQKGQAAIILIGAANRDPAVFADPDRLDVGRAPNPHIAFGSGVHLCLGARLARAIGQAAVQTLLQEFPRIRLGDDEPQWCETVVPRGLRTLPVRLD